jgi:hypothetical protein
MHQNLKAKVERLYFAGKPRMRVITVSCKELGLRAEVGERIAGMILASCVNANMTADGEGNITVSGYSCSEDEHYDILRGTTDLEEYCGMPAAS